MMGRPSLLCWAVFSPFWRPTSVSGLAGLRRVRGHGYGHGHGHEQPHLALSARAKSTIALHPPAKDAEREVPTPLLFLAAPRWENTPPAAKLYASWIEHFSKHGYSSLLLDLDPYGDAAEGETKGPLPDASELMSRLEKDMASLIRSAPGGAPFPPVLLARGLATLAAQTYASSHPLSALQLLDPPLSTSAAQSSHPALLTGAPLAEYDFEPRFPVRVVWSAEEMERQRKEGIPWYEAHRIEHLLEEEAEESLDRVELRDAEKDGPEEMRRWLEEVVGLEDPSEALDTESSVEFFDEGSELEPTHSGTRPGSAVESESDLESQSDSDLDGEMELEILHSGKTTVEIRRRSNSAERQSTGSGEVPEWYTRGGYVVSPVGSKKIPIVLDESDLEESFVRGSGPGGQAINKLSTSVSLLHKPTGIRVQCQLTRSRNRNRMFARRVMSQKLDQLVHPGTSALDKKWQKIRQRKAKKKQKRKAEKRLLAKAKEGAEGETKSETKPEAPSKTKTKKKSKAKVKAAADKAKDNEGSQEGEGMSG